MADSVKSSTSGIKATRERLRREDWLNRSGRTRVDLKDRHGFVIPQGSIARVCGTSTLGQSTEDPVTLRANIQGRDRLVSIKFEQIFIAGFPDEEQIDAKWEPDERPTA